MESCVSVRRKVWKYHMKGIMIEETVWDNIVAGFTVKGQVACVCREEVVQELNEILRHHRASEVS